VKSYRKELHFQIKTRRAYLNITPQIEAALAESGIREGLCLVNAMQFLELAKSHATAIMQKHKII
jgi:thiamine phosphate synthase YjbQ (UPF0047 family)